MTSKVHKAKARIIGFLLTDNRNKQSNPSVIRTIRREGVFFGLLGNPDH